MILSALICPIRMDDRNNPLAFSAFGLATCPGKSGYTSPSQFAKMARYRSEYSPAVRPGYACRFRCSPARASKEALTISGCDPGLECARLVADDRQIGQSIDIGCFVIGSERDAMTLCDML